MPLYDYSCERCGGFRDWRSMAMAGEPVPCPDCGSLAPRAISAPFFTRLDRGTRIAHERNEKSAHEPAVVRREALESGAYGRPFHRHARGGRNPPWAIGH